MNKIVKGCVSERSKEPDLRSGVNNFAGSNPAVSILFKDYFSNILYLVTANNEQEDYN